MFLLVDWVGVVVLGVGVCVCVVDVFVVCEDLVVEVCFFVD